MSGSKRAKIRPVTAYVPILDHPRSAAEYGKLGDALRNALGGFVPIEFYQTVPDLWMTPFIERLAAGGHHIQHSQGDNPVKNSMEYHAVQHQKFEWLEQAAERDTGADTFIWIDYGAMRQPGFNKDLLQEFLGRIKKNDLAMPGCWEKKDVIDYYPCWRFCGTVFIVPRQDVKPLNSAFKAVTRMRVRSTKNVSWEVNDLAVLELTHVGPPIRWYAADHNARMLTGY